MLRAPPRAVVRAAHQPRRPHPARPGRHRPPNLRKVWVDGGYRKHFIEHAATFRIDLEIVQRHPGTRGFAPIPKRWAVERTYGWLMLHRRLARDYARHPHRSAAMIHLAMTDLMARRITGENTISWRDPTPAHQSRVQG